MVGNSNHCSDESENQKGKQAHPQHNDTSWGPGRPRLVFEERGPELGQMNVANRGPELRLDPQIDLFISNSRPARSQTQYFRKVIIRDYGTNTGFHLVPNLSSSAPSNAVWTESPGSRRASESQTRMPRAARPGWPSRPPGRSPIACSRSFAVDRGARLHPPRPRHLWGSCHR